MVHMCLAGEILPLILSMFVPLDVTHMSRIVTGAKSWTMMSLCPVHDCYSVVYVRTVTY